MVAGSGRMTTRYGFTECCDTACMAHGVAVLHARAALGRRMEIVRSFGTFQPFNPSTFQLYIKAHSGRDVSTKRPRWRGRDGSTSRPRCQGSDVSTKRPRSRDSRRRTRRGRVPTIMMQPGGHAFFCTHDGNKNVSEVFFFQQAYGIAAHYEYAPFGAVTAATRNTSVTSVDVRTFNPFRFSSEYADDTLGLVYYNYRHYSPCDGRWMGRDSIRELFGLIRFDAWISLEYTTYLFVHNQPFSALWKLRYLDIPSDGTCYWLAYGHTMFETYYDKLDPCTCEFKDGKEVKVENYNRRRRSGK